MRRTFLVLSAALAIGLWSASATSFDNLQNASRTAGFPGAGVDDLPVELVAQGGRSVGGVGFQCGDRTPTHCTCKGKKEGTDCKEMARNCTGQWACWTDPPPGGCSCVYQPTPAPARTGGTNKNLRPTMNPGLLETGPGMGSQGPSATGSPVGGAPKAPPPAKIN